MIKRVKNVLCLLSLFVASSHMEGADTLPFALKVSSEIASESCPFLISPLSLFRTMSVLSLGAEGETRKELLNFIEMNQKEEVFIPYLVQQTNVLYPEVRCSTGIFTAPQITLRKEFSEKIKTFCPEATIASCDFQRNPEGATTFINDWISRATDGKIEKLLQSGDIKGDTVCAVVDALTFKASWKSPFVKELIEKAPFHAPHGDMSVSMMQQEGKITAYQRGDVSYVELPYKEEGKGHFVLELLMGAKGPQEEVSKIFQKVRKNAASTKVHLRVPQMMLRQRTVLTQALKRLGLKESFSNKAQFLGISYTPMALQEVIQEAYLKVYEEGSEGAAATAATMRCTSVLNPSPCTYITFDQPFWLVLREKTTDSILFFAYVTSP